MTEIVKPPPAVVAALRSSGFPFQTAVAHAVEAAPGWRIHASEYPWQRDDETHFLDLVATNGVFYLTIECKKTRKEILTFLRPLRGPVGPTTGLVGEFRCLRACNTDDSTQPIGIVCETWQLSPRSNLSEFCVVATSDSGKDQRLLERDAGLLIHATDAFAQSLVRPGRELPLAALVIPVIVTNAPIYTARYRPNSVSLESGEFETSPDDVTKPECVRFQKSFPSDAESADLGNRTVFVVNALSIIEFLSLIGPQPGETRGTTPVKFQWYRDLSLRGLGAS
jgi:hypothetical protein